MRLRASTLALLATTTVWALHLALTLPGLPDPLATQFGGGGRPTAWMSHRGYLLFELLMVGVAAAVVFGVSAAVPSHQMNVPNRGYWFAPERAAEGRARMRAWLRCFLAGMLVFLTGLNAMLAEANARVPPSLEGSTLLLLVCGTLIGVGASVAALYALFPPPR